MPSAVPLRILVTGSSGGYGQSIIKCMLRDGVDPQSLILVSRSPAKLAEFEQYGCETRRGSFDDPVNVLAKSFVGAEIMLMISTSRAGARLPQHQNAIDAAVKAGVRQVIYTSFIGAGLEQPTALVVQEHCATEKMLRNSGLYWTALRDGMYSEAIAQVAGPAAIATGSLPTNAGEGLIAFISRDDCVEAAAAVLRDPSSHRNQVYNITGPELLTWRDAAAMLTKVSGRDVHFKALSEEEQFEFFDQMGIPRHPSDEYEKDGVSGYHWNSSDMVSFGKALRLGEMEVLSNDVETLTGRKPRSFLQVLEDNLSCR